MINSFNSEQIFFLFAFFDIEIYILFKI